MCKRRAFAYIAVPFNFTGVKVGVNTQALHQLWSRFRTAYSNSLFYIILFKIDHQEKLSGNASIEDFIFDCLSYARVCPPRNELFYRFGTNDHGQSEDLLPAYVQVFSF